MSIVLKTDPRNFDVARIRSTLQEPGLYSGLYAAIASAHDALAAHAMQMAIEELEYSFRKALNERAAANLARLMGEGND